MIHYVQHIHLFNLSTFFDCAIYQHCHTQDICVHVAEISFTLCYINQVKVIVTGKCHHVRVVMISTPQISFSKYRGLYVNVDRVYRIF